MGDGIAEMNKAIYTHTDGEKYILVGEESSGSCAGCFFDVDDMDCELLHQTKPTPCGRHGIFRPLQTPLDAAEEDLKQKGTKLGEARAPSTDSVKDPAHYADSYPCGIEVFQMIDILMTQLDLSELNNYQIYQLGNVFKYRLRAGYKDDGGEVWGQVDLAKAMRCREMLDE